MAKWGSILILTNEVKKKDRKINSKSYWHYLEMEMIGEEKNRWKKKVKGKTFGLSSANTYVDTG